MIRLVLNLCLFLVFAYGDPQYDYHLPDTIPDKSLVPVFRTTPSSTTVQRRLSHHIDHDFTLPEMPYKMQYGEYDYSDITTANSHFDESGDHGKMHESDHGDGDDDDDDDDKRHHGDAAGKCNTNYKFPCDDGRCIFKSEWCDGIVNCEDQSDEYYCNGEHACLQSHFSCKNGKCVPSAAVCDEDNDCGDYSDEAFDCADEYDYSDITTANSHFDESGDHGKMHESDHGDGDDDDDNMHNGDESRNDHLAGGSPVQTKLLIPLLLTLILLLLLL